MADNVQITAGTGTTISTDDAGANGQVQRVKLTYSADGDATHIPADVNGLLVNPTLERATTGDASGVTVSTSAVQILASNTSAKNRIISNNGTTNIYISRQNTVTATGAAMGILLKPGGTYCDSGIDIYTGAIYGIGDAVSASQNVAAWERT